MFILKFNYGMKIIFQFSVISHYWSLKFSYEFLTLTVFRFAPLGLLKQGVYKTSSLGPLAKIKHSQSVHTIIYA